MCEGQLLPNKCFESYSVVSHTQYTRGLLLLLPQPAERFLESLLLLLALLSRSSTMQHAAAGDRAFVNEEYQSAIQHYTKVILQLPIVDCWV